MSSGENKDKKQHIKFIYQSFFNELRMCICMCLRMWYVFKVSLNKVANV